MATVVIGGHSSNIGKTSVVCALIAAMRERRWTAIKITQCRHDAARGETCDCGLAGQSAAILEEHGATMVTDSSRYLAAGAVRSLWVRTRQGELAAAMPGIGAEMARAENVILESNSVLRFLKPDVYACVLDPEIADFKESALLYLDRADALLIQSQAEFTPAWSGVPVQAMAGKPRFRIAPPSYASADFAAFVAQTLDARLGVAGSATHAV